MKIKYLQNMLIEDWKNLNNYIEDYLPNLTVSLCWLENNKELEINLTGGDFSLSLTIDNKDYKITLKGLDVLKFKEYELEDYVFDVLDFANYIDKFLNKKYIPAVYIDNKTLDKIKSLWSDLGFDVQDVISFFKKIINYFKKGIEGFTPNFKIMAKNGDLCIYYFLEFCYSGVIVTLGIINNKDDRKLTFERRYEALDNINVLDIAKELKEIQIKYMEDLK